MKRTQVYTLFLLFVISSCKGQNKPGISNDNTTSNSSDRVARRADPGVHTSYEYTDSSGKRLVIQNGNPKGGTKYTDPDGEEYAYAVFWTRIINETDQPITFNIEFANTYEVPDLPGKYFKLVVLPDSLEMDKMSMFNYGRENIESFLDKNIHKLSSLKRTINSKASGGFYVLKINLREKGAGGGDILRTGLMLKGQDFYYRVTRYSSTEERKPPALITEKDIECGRIDLKGLTLQSN